MTPQFKFLRRVRIHGGECGAVARALHHEVKGSSLYQADSGKALESTIERKQMSTKTTLKRIALVAVSALGFGLMSVVPVNAAPTLTSVSVGTLPSVRVGETATVAITVNMSANATSSDTVTVAAKAVSGPLLGGISNAASALVYSTAASQTPGLGDQFLYFASTSGGTLGANTEAAYGGITTSTRAADAAYYQGNIYEGTAAGAIGGGGTAGGKAAASVTVATGSTLTTTVYLSFKLDVAGSYTFLVSADEAVGTATGANFAYVAGDVSTTFTVTTGAQATTATLTNVGGSSTSPDGTYGVLYKVTFADSTGAATTLTGDETFTITPNLGYVSKASVATSGFDSSASYTGTSAVLGRADLVNGVGFINARYATASSTVVLSGAGSGTLPATVTATASYTTAAAKDIASGVTWNRAASANNSVTTGWKSSGAVIPTTATSSSLELAKSQSADGYGFVTFEDTTGRISNTATPGSGAGLGFDKPYTITAAADYAVVTVSHQACASGTCWTMTDSGAGFSAQAVTSEARDVTSSLGSIAVASPATSVRSATSGSVTFIVTVRDQFRGLLANEGVSLTASGRNSAKAAATVVTNASGQSSFTFTDAGTTGTTDTLTFNAGGATATATITYGDSVAGSIIVDTPSTDGFTSTTNAGGDTYPKAFSDIYATGGSTVGAEYGAITVTALVKDASSNVMVGVPVSWSVTGTGCAILSSSATTYTGSNGEATSSLYAWLAGTCVVSATAGGKTDTANSYWRQDGPTEVRSISATTSGNVITATAKDRFGNPVRSVDVKAVRVSGSGFIGSSTSITAATDDNGQVSFLVTGGSGTFKVGFSTDIYGQSDALAGKVDGTSSSSTNVFLAYTAGDALTDEEGVGSTYSAAGVNSVEVPVTAVDAAATAAEAATDAAAEAIDAANAATDAANLAAEAADAATVAAEEARDAADAATAAVEELATQVATLMAALKAQITTLANTVAKIAKKVKA